MRNSRCSFEHSTCMKQRSRESFLIALFDDLSYNPTAHRSASCASPLTPGVSRPFGSASRCGCFLLLIDGLLSNGVF